MKNNHQLSCLAVILAGFCSPSFAAIEVFKDEHTSIVTQGFIRVVYQKVDEFDQFTDSGSRLGFKIFHQIQNDWTIGINVEWGTQFEVNGNFSIGGNSQPPADGSDAALTSRLGNVFLTHDDWGQITLGKQFSVYYLALYHTDWYNFWGGSANGAFNLGTDGGFSGTGRAEQALSWTRSFGAIDLGVQLHVQDEPLNINLRSCAEEDLPDQLCRLIREFNGQELGRTGNGYGLSFGYNWNRWLFSLAYNLNNVNVDPVFGNLGFKDGKDEIWGAGIKYGEYGAQGLYAAAMYNESSLHEVDDSGLFYDAKGSELMVKYNVNNYGAYAGYNDLRARDSSTPYQLHHTLAGVEYRFDHISGLVFFEAKRNDLVFNDGSVNDEFEFAVGVTYNLY
ncbi:porin [Thalassotalea mangrovi]|uniref:Porin n=1 Tax=Thalassotalea mangrovi TaxID=2572245 RepID=A0A4U1B8I6_9GAMM|nr:porin [Thalassotalea mangrovi]TKB46906.1 porin [Thalassotalea mangrovi]